MILLIVTLFIIIIQDLKSRAISWWTIPLLLGSIMYVRLVDLDWNIFLLEGGMNLLFLSLQFLLVTIYFSIKKRQITNIADTYLGLGDILFLIPISFLFPTINFVLFYITSVIAVLIGFLFYKKLINRNVETIPLAGGQAIYLMLVLFFSKVFDFNMEGYFFPPLY